MSYMVVQEHVDPRNLSVNITSSNGRVFRWGPDESQAQNVPSGLTIATAIPGGFTTCDCTLNRRADLTYYDLDRFAPFTVTGQSGALVAFDGYLSQAALERSTTYQFSPEAIGWSAHMTDDNSFSMVYIDRMLSAWIAPTTSRQEQLITGNIGVDSITSQVQTDPGGNPAIAFITTGPIPSATQAQRCELWYDAGANNDISIWQYSQLTGVNLTINDANSTLNVGTSADGTNTAGEYSFKNNTSYNSGTNLTSDRYCYFYWSYDSGASSGTAGVTYGFDLENVAVIGNHGLTLQTGPSGLSPGPDDGFYGYQLVTDIITRAAPLLSTGGIAQDSFVVPQMVFNTPTDADTAVQSVNQYYQNDYGVYENREFFWRPAATGTEWHVRLNQGVQLQDQGPQIETAINGVVVQYTDAAGVTRYVGPPGYGGDATSSSLQDTSSTNPCNEYGRKRWTLLQMLGLSTSAAAIDAGANYLQTSLVRTASGSVTVMGFAKDSNGREWPAWRIRSGDTVVVDDASDTSAHYILGTSYDHDSLTNTLTIDAPPDTSSWLLQRLNLAVSALG